MLYEVKQREGGTVSPLFFWKHCLPQDNKILKSLILKDVKTITYGRGNTDYATAVTKAN